MWCRPSERDHRRARVVRGRPFAVPSYYSVVAGDAVWRSTEGATTMKRIFFSLLFVSALASAVSLGTINCTSTYGYSYPYESAYVYDYYYPADTMYYTYYWTDPSVYGYY